MCIPPETVTGATVEVVFRNSMGQIVQRETLPLMLYHTGLAGFPDVAPLSAAPLMPNQTRDFRLTFEHISSNGAADGMRCDVDGNLWAGAPPGVQIVAPSGEPIGMIRLPENCANVVRVHVTR